MEPIKNQKYKGWMLLDPFHGQHSGDPNNDRRKENPDSVGRKSFPLSHFEQVCGNGARIYPGAGQRNHDKQDYSQKSILPYFASRPLFCPLTHIDRRFFIEPPLHQIPVDVLQKEHHHREHQHIGQKASDEHNVLVHPMVDPIGNAHFGLSKWGQAPKYRYDQIFVQELPIY